MKVGPMRMQFPNFKILQICLTSGSMPESVTLKPARFACGEGEELWVETAARLSTGAQRELKRLGAVVCKSSGASLSGEVSSWLELLPLVREEIRPETLEQAPVLFDVPGGAELSHLVMEMLRLGNDRQSFRWLQEDGEGGRALLRVVGPPYYSLLRALDQLGGPGVAPHAFIERTPGVWVELGYRHPLMANIRPPKGKLLLLRPPRLWTLIPETPFRDVYEVIEFQLPDGSTQWRDEPLQARLRVAPRLRQAGPADGAELWVLRGEATDELNRFVQNAEDQLLGRLSFAVGEKNGQKIVVLRVRPSKLPPPVVLLPAEAYRSYLKLPNLFLPAGSILHPPLRRDIVRKLLAEDVNHVTWLTPDADGTFTPESLPDDVFRPLTDWVDYVLDRDKEMLQAWVQAMQFDFEPFICTEEQPARPKKPPAAEKPRGPKPGRSGEAAAGATGETMAFEGNTKEAEGGDEEAVLDPFAAVEEAEPSEVQKELATVEAEFLALPGTLDDDAHRALWPRLAELNARLEKMEDASICWLNALWEAKDSVNEDRIARWTAAWFRTEALGAAQHPLAGERDRSSWIARLAAAPGGDREVKAADLDVLLRNDEPAVADVRALAAYLAWSAQREPHPTALMQKLPAVQRFLEKHERLLPVRACWLAWYHLVRLLGGDELALARARDRLLERLFHNGLRPEQDLPSFLRFAGQPSRERFRDVSQWLGRLHGLALDWLMTNRGSLARSACTEAYADLVFSFGLAQLGAYDRAKQLLTSAQQRLPQQYPVHAVLLAAYHIRIETALANRDHSGPLPATLLARFQALPMLERYIIERVRHNSRILEPEQQLNPYRYWEAQRSDLDKELMDLLDAPITAASIKQLRSILKQNQGADTLVKVLRVALELAPQLGESFALELLQQALSLWQRLPATCEPSLLEERAHFLQKALFVAAHFGHAASVQPLVQGLVSLFKASPSLELVALLTEQAFRSLRKFGLRDEMDSLLQQLARSLLQGKDLEALPQLVQQQPASLPALLQLAGAWYYFGRDDQAQGLLTAASGLLYSNQLPQIKQRRDVACAYIRAVGQAPPEVCRSCLEEIFTQLHNYHDSFTTSAYFSVVQIDLLESLVLTVVHDDFIQSAQARRWLDEEEYYIRRRLHRDFQKLLEAA